MSAFDLAYHVLVARDEAAEFDYQLYRYKPSIAAAIIFVILFLITTSLHGYQMFRTRTWFYIPFFIGGLFETVGYIGRAASASQTYQEWTLGPFIIQSLLLLVAPALFAASIYMELGRIVELVEGDKYLFVPRRWMTSIFVAGDILSFLMQGSGGGLMGAGNLDSVHTGEKIIVAGLFVQIAFFGMFIVVAYLFHKRMHQVSTPRGLRVPWKRHMYALYFISILILIRSIFRVIEFLQGNDGYLLTYEVFLYVFDAVLMWLVMCCMNWIHPSEIRSYLKGGPWTRGIKVHNDVQMQYQMEEA